MSEWAARGPACRRGTDDAESWPPERPPVGMDPPAAPEPPVGTDPPATEPPVGTDQPVGTAPAVALDPTVLGRRGHEGDEPLADRRAGTLLIGAIIAVFLAGAALTPIVGPSRGGPMAGGRVLSVAYDNGVGWSAPNGSGVMRLPNLGTLADEGLIAAPDCRYLATSTGRVVAVSDNSLIDSGVRARFRGQLVGDGLRRR